MRISDQPTEEPMARETRAGGAMRRGRSICPKTRTRDNVTATGVEFLDEGVRLKRRIQSFLEAKTDDDVARERLKLQRNLEIH